MDAMKLACGTLVLLAGLGSTTWALAYCRTTTCDPEEGKPDSCEELDGCLVGGKDLFWASPCISFSVQEDGSPRRRISADEASAAIGAGYAQWTGVTCEEGGQPALDVYELSPVECRRQEYNQDQPNANAWVFRDEAWPYEETGTLALTTVTYNVETGEIYDADVEVNSFENPITVNAGSDEFDFQSIATHEAGHVLGLSHSDNPNATMYAEYGPAMVSSRALDVDDVRGICAVIPPGQVPAECDPTPRHGFSTQCASEESGCSARPGGGAPRSASGALLAALLAGFLVRRSRRSAARSRPR